MQSKLRPIATVLVVDDNADLRDSVSVLLNYEGFHVVTAADGQAALDLLQTDGPRPSLIVLDGGMPIMDGFEFFNRQQQDPTLAGIPVLIYSGVADVSKWKEQGGPVAYCVKTWDMEELIRLVKQHAVSPG